jgi:hypothetical protein
LSGIPFPHDGRVLLIETMDSMKGLEDEISTNGRVRPFKLMQAEYLQLVGRYKEELRAQMPSQVSGTYRLPEFHGFHEERKTFVFYWDPYEQCLARFSGTGSPTLIGTQTRLHASYLAWQAFLRNERDGLSPSTVPFDLQEGYEAIVREFPDVKILYWRLGTTSYSISACLRNGVWSAFVERPEGSFSSRFRWDGDRFLRCDTSGTSIPEHTPLLESELSMREWEIMKTVFQGGAGPRGRVYVYLRRTDESGV